MPGDGAPGRRDRREGLRIGEGVTQVDLDDRHLVCVPEVLAEVLHEGLDLHHPEPGQPLPRERRRRGDGRVAAVGPAKREHVRVERVGEAELAPVVGGAEQGPVDELRRRRRPGADGAEGAGPGLGDQRVGRDRQGGRPRAILEHGRDPVRHPARGERRRQERRVAERRPDQPAGRVGEAGHRVPGRRRRLRHAEPEPAVPRKVLEFDRSDEDGRIETAERVVADVLDAGRVVGAEGLAPHRVADDDPLAAGGEPGDQCPLQIEALLGAPVVARHQASVDGADRVAGTVVSDPRGEQEVRAKPAGLDPGRAHPAAGAHPPGPEQVVDPDRLERHRRAGSVLLA